MPSELTNSPVEGVREGGTIGRAIAASRRKGFSLVFPVGLEKLVPNNLEEAAKEAIKTRYDYAMGVNCGLLPCKEGTVITEPKAVEILSGATAIPIAAGGLDGAEGAITMVIKGEKEQVARAMNEQARAGQDMTSAAQSTSKQIALITRANREHSVVATKILSDLSDIREITDRNAAGVKDTQRAATSLLARAQTIGELVDQMADGR